MGFLGRSTTRPRSPKPPLIGGVTLFFHQLGAAKLVDLGLEGGPSVVGAIHRPRQLHKARSKIAGPLTVADAIFNVPELAVDGP